MWMLIAIDVLIFNPDKYLPHIIVSLTVIGIVVEICRQLGRSTN